MTNTLKTLAISGLLGTFAAPVFAISTSMACDEYNQLSGAMRDKVAMMAILELNDNVDPGDGTASATASSVGEAATESEAAATQGSATATSIAGAGDDMSRYAEELAVLNRVCSRNWDAMVKEAAAGQFGTR